MSFFLKGAWGKICKKILYVYIELKIWIIFDSMTSHFHSYTQKSTPQTYGGSTRVIISKDCQDITLKHTQKFTCLKAKLQLLT